VVREGRRRMRSAYVPYIGAWVQSSVSNFLCPAAVAAGGQYEYFLSRHRGMALPVRAFPWPAARQHHAKRPGQVALHGRESLGKTRRGERQCIFSRWLEQSDDDLDRSEPSFSACWDGYGAPACAGWR
jgi:hypothetical protein